VNVLSLKYPNCFKCSSILHELIHSLGFYHEQQRIDRDEYVKINWDNISPGNTLEILNAVWTLFVTPYSNVLEF